MNAKCIYVEREPHNGSFQALQGVRCDTNSKPQKDLAISNACHVDRLQINCGLPARARNIAKCLVI